MASNPEENTGVPSTGAKGKEKATSELGNEDQVDRNDPGPYEGYAKHSDEELVESHANKVLIGLKDFVQPPRDTMSMPISLNVKRNPSTNLAHNNLGLWLCCRHPLFPESKDWKWCETLGWCVLENKAQRENLLKQNDKDYVDAAADKDVAYWANPPATDTCLYRESHQSEACGFSRLNHPPRPMNANEIWEKLDPKNPAALEKLKIEIGYKKVIYRQKLMNQYAQETKEADKNSASLAKILNESDSEEYRDDDDNKSLWRANWYCVGCSVDRQQAACAGLAAWRNYAFNPVAGRPKAHIKQYMLVFVLVDGHWVERYCWINSIGGEYKNDETHDGLTCTNVKFGRGPGEINEVCGWRYGSPPKWGTDENNFSVCLRP